MRSNAMGTTLALAAFLAAGAAAHAQEATEGFGDLAPPDMSAPSAAREYHVCPDREPRPEWLDALDAQEGYKGVLLMRIYEARSYEAIVGTGDCSCANRAPSWDAAEAEYNDSFAQLDPEAQRAITREFRGLRDDNYSGARAICEEQGNW